MNITDVRGVIFDLDDTLLDNYPGEIPLGLHEHSRLRAAHEVGKRHNIPGLQELAIEQAHQAFRDAPVHSLHGATWQSLVMLDIAHGEMDLEHPLLCELVELKDELHEETLRTHGKQVPGAVEFIENLVAQGLGDKLAIASTAYRRDALVFFDMANLGRFFPDDRLITRELFVHPKPHPEAFETAFQTLKLPSKTGVIAFEDDPRGVMSAKAAGLYTCAITTRFSKEDLAALAVPPDLIAGSYAEFSELLGLGRPMQTEQ